MRQVARCLAQAIMQQIRHVLLWQRMTQPCAATFNGDASKCKILNFMGTPGSCLEMTNLPLKKPPLAVQL